MPEAFSMKASDEGVLASISPAAMASALAAFQPFGPGVVGADQFLVRDRLFGREQAGGGDDGFLHCVVP
jgi:hypothetical protein